MNHNELASKRVGGYFYLDVLKVFLSICVVAIHAKIGESISN